jgi:Cft2 family RNA processing exonuclease
MIEWRDGLCLTGANLFFDRRLPSRDCVITHAHSDHIASHDRAIATAPTTALCNLRQASKTVISLRFHEDFAYDESTTLKLLPAGHVFGSAMIHARRPEGSLLYTGDFKLRSGLTAEPAEAVPADTLLMESTFGQPFFRFPHRQIVIEQFLELVEAAFSENRQPIALGYSLGKSQEIIRILTDAGIAVTAHGAVANINRVYKSCGMDVGPHRAYRYADFHGPRQLDLRERGLLVAPMHLARSAFCTQFANPCRFVLTGWALLKNAIYRYGVEHALPLSDHADFDELLEMIERVQPKKIVLCHGYREFCEILRGRGLDARWIKPDPQLMLFSG